VPGGVAAPAPPAALVHRPGHDLSVAEVSRIYHDDHAGADRLLHVPELAGTWRPWAEKFATDGPRTRG
jgi:hypothetical protein